MVLLNKNLNRQLYIYVPHPFCDKLSQEKNKKTDRVHERGDMSRNVCSDENGRFDGILWTRLADLTKFDKFGNFIKYDKCNEISQIQLTKFYEGIYNSWQEEPHEVDEYVKKEEI